MMTEEAASGTEEAAETAVLESEEGPIANAGVSGVGSGVSRRKLESRRKLMAAARKLFVERGYHETRPQDISREAGVGHGTFYLHFEDKLDCFLAFTDEAANELDGFLQKHLAGAGTLEAVTREILRGTFEYTANNPGVLAAALNDVSVLWKGDMGRKAPATRWSEGWAAILEELKQSKQVAEDVDCKLAGYLIVGAIKQGGAYAARDQLDHEFYIDNVTRLFVRALKAQ
ncbi:MAG: TetR/AcrR family transcriptional regulator [Parvibaculum sp.]|uniref:TetR/AcrR family transcriptional regulator n=1 Tax=Parvibaculum sp. TaxID=2024848 RepID=UPI003C7248DF